MAQGAAVSGIKYTLWVVSDPSGNPIRIVMIKWTAQMRTDVLKAQQLFLAKAFKWADRNESDPSINDLEAILGNGAFDLKYARSADAVWQNLLLGRRLFDFMDDQKRYALNMVVKRLHPAIALCWNAWKGADDSRTGMQNSGRVGVQARLAKK